MLNPCVLIQTEVGKVAHALSGRDSVQVAEDLAGPTTSSPGRRRPIWISWAGWWPPASRSWTASPAP
jgi:hypothetical protein